MVPGAVDRELSALGARIDGAVPHQLVEPFVQVFGFESVEDENALRTAQGRDGGAASGR